MLASFLLLSGCGARVVGNGVFVNETGMIATVAHAVRTCSEITVSSASLPPVRATVVAISPVDAVDDSAILTTGQPSPAFLAIAPEASSAFVPENFDRYRLVIFGFQGLESTVSSVSTALLGSAAAVHPTTRTEVRFWLIATDVLPGTSGSPVLDRDNRVIGLVSQKIIDASEQGTTTKALKGTALVPGSYLLALAPTLSIAPKGTTTRPTDAVVRIVCKR